MAESWCICLAVGQIFASTNRDFAIFGACLLRRLHRTVAIRPGVFPPQTPYDLRVAVELMAFRGRSVKGTHESLDLPPRFADASQAASDSLHRRVIFHEAAVWLFQNPDQSSGVRDSHENRGVGSQNVALLHADALEEPAPWLGSCAPTAPPREPDPRAADGTQPDQALIDLDPQDPHQSHNEA